MKDNPPCLLCGRRDGHSHNDIPGGSVVGDRAGHDEVKMPRGGTRVGAGRPKKLVPDDAAAALLTAAVYELSIGQSSVELAMDSKGAVKPSVKVYHRSARMAAKMARAIFDELATAYCPQTA